MLELKNIKKSYVVGDSTVEALKGVSIEFRKNEFVSILGPSGCGKTTLLNIIGGLDRYSDGDLIIRGKSTKTFKDSDWDTYRNHSIGFVFQSYNLIPHQTVLANVELALTLSGVSKAERRRRATEALEAVGLGDQLNKRPSQMSGGQMQRVAIARALVNDPDILLADEPTGALDTATSVQIMEILKEISKDKLIIMVTHNPELAATYSTRIIKVLDGLVINDSDPYVSEKQVEEAAPEPEKKTHAQKKADKKEKAKTSMSFWTALSLSFNNLRTKKGRTIMTSFAGSIGIIGIALILALSQGINEYIASVQRDTLSSFPISIYAEEADISSMLSTIMDSQSTEDKEAHGTDAIYPNLVMSELVQNITSAETKKNNLKPFKSFLDDTENNGLEGHVSAIQYSYNIDLNMYAMNKYGNYNDTSLENLFSTMMGSGTNTTGTTSSISSLMDTSTMFAAYDVWTELLPGEKNADGTYSTLVNDVVKSQYTVVAGDWPSAKDEVILVLDEYNEITDITLFSLGLISKQDMIKTVTLAMTGQENTDLGLSESYSYEDILNISFKMVLNSDFYRKAGDGTWVDMRENTDAIGAILNDALDVKVVGIVKPAENATAAPIGGTLAYTAALTEYAIAKTNESAIAKELLAAENKNLDIFTGLPFVVDTPELTDEEKAVYVNNYVKDITSSEKAQIYRDIYCTPSDEYVETMYEQYKKEIYGDAFNTMSSDEKRDKLAQMIVNNNLLQGIDYETAMSLLSSYNDTELELRAKKMISEIIIENYYERKSAELDAIINPSVLSNSLQDSANASMYAQLKASIEAGILSQIQLDTAGLESLNAMINAGILEANHAKKIVYITSAYSTETGLGMDTYFPILMQKSADEIDVLFDALVDEMTMTQYAQIARLDQALYDNILAEMFDTYIAENAENEEVLVTIYNDYIPDGTSSNTYEDNLKKVGICDLEDPDAVYIYAATFEDKEYIADVIADYNDGKSESDQVSYTDYVAMLMSSITIIINAISYVLVAFVSISLIVSSIMIGIITNISVLERTKEIGILRAIGASKRDVSRVFNAETMIIGLAAGLLGIAMTVLLCFPISWIVQALTGIPTLRAYVPPLAGVILVLISVGLTLIAGLIPARSAAKKDPVIALRTE